MLIKVVRNILVTLPLLALASMVGAAESGEGDELYTSEWVISVGAFKPKIDTSIRIDGSGGIIGTKLDMETLGLDQTQVLPSLGIDWQINKRHSLWGYFFDVNRNGFSSTDVIIRVGETEFPISTDLNAYFKARIYALGYGYAFINDPDKFFGLQVGLNVQHVSLGLEGELGILSETADATAPLPTFGFVGGYRLSDRWYLSGNAGYFAAKIDVYDGAITQFEVDLDYAITEHVMLGVAYQMLKVDVSSSDQDWNGELLYEYSGPSLNFRYSF